MENKTNLFICSTCGTKKKTYVGKKLLEEIKTLLNNDKALLDKVNIVPISCLGGCDTPCNAALAEHEKGSIVLSELTVENAQHLLDILQIYINSDSGRIFRKKLPPELQKYYKYRIPPLQQG